jgi:hypothetical protein
VLSSHMHASCAKAIPHSSRSDVASLYFCNMLVRWVDGRGKDTQKASCAAIGYLQVIGRQPTAENLSRSFQSLFIKT